MTKDDLQRMVAEIAAKYPSPIITTKEAAEISRHPLATIYEWSSRGKFDAFSTKKGRHLLLDRDAFVRWLWTAAD